MKPPRPSTLDPVFSVSFLTLPKTLSLGVLYAFFLGEGVAIIVVFVFMIRHGLRSETNKLIGTSLLNNQPMLAGLTPLFNCEYIDPRW